jgi:transposase, IS6 family
LPIFKRRRFPIAIVPLCVCWYCKSGISYCAPAEMMSEHSGSVNPSTIFRWVQRYAPEIEKRVQRHQGHRSGSWRVDETYVRGGRCWRYSIRAVDKHSRLIASMLSNRRDTGAAYHFLRKALTEVSDCPPSSITTDRLASFPKAIRCLQNEGLPLKDVEHRTSNYLNNNQPAKRVQHARLHNSGTAAGAMSAETAPPWAARERDRVLEKACLRPKSSQKGHFGPLPQVRLVRTNPESRCTFI